MRYRLPGADWKNHPTRTNRRNSGSSLSSKWTTYCSMEFILVHNFMLTSHQLSYMVMVVVISWWFRFWCCCCRCPLSMVQPHERVTLTCRMDERFSPNASAVYWVVRVEI